MRPDASLLRFESSNDIVGICISSSPIAPRPAILELQPRDFLQHFYAQRRHPHAHHRIFLDKEVVRRSRESKLSNRLNHLGPVVGIRPDPDIHVDRVSDIPKCIHRVAADQQKSGLTDDEQLQEFSEIAWYPGRSHSKPVGSVPALPAALASSWSSNKLLHRMASRSSQQKLRSGPFGLRQSTPSPDMNRESRRKTWPN